MAANNQQQRIADNEGEKKAKEIIASKHDLKRDSLSPQLP